MLWFFLTRHPCRIVTTSAKDQHLRVLWGEIGQAIGTSRYPLDSKRGGPLVCNHHDLRKLLTPGDKNSRCPLSYAVGMVASQDSQAAMQGHHATATLEDYLQRGMAECEEDIDHGLPRSLFVVDEASSVPDYYLGLAQTWAKRIFVFGNPWPCSNFFFRDVEGVPGGEDRGGDLLRGDERDERPQDVSSDRAAVDPTTERDRGGEGNGAGVSNPGRSTLPTSGYDPSLRLGAGQPSNYLRRVIRITAEDSPNVQLARQELAAGLEPSNTVIVPGVLTWQEFCDRKRTYDEHQQEVSLWGRFYKGKELYLFPRLWLDRAELIAAGLLGRPRRAKAIGIDPGEGEANTALAAVDEYGLIELVAKKTPNTAEIFPLVFNFVRKHQVLWENVVLDRGGGGKMIADVLRNGALIPQSDGPPIKLPGGYPVRTIAFGESILPEVKSGKRTLPEKKEHREDKYVYYNRRAEMYGELALLMDPGMVGSIQGENRIPVNGFGLPRMFMGLLRPEMEPIPKWLDGEGRLILPSKHRKPGEETNEKKKTLVELCGRSPDALESIVLAVHGLLHKPRRSVAGVA